MRAQEAFRVKLLCWYASIVAAGKAMPRSEMKRLLEWERRNLGGSIATSDWPGWERYVGKRPEYSEEASLNCAGYIYVVRASTGEYKIGRSGDVSARLQSLITSAPCALELVHKIPADDCRSAEKMLHAKYFEKKLRGEWYRLDQADLADLLSMREFTGGAFIGCPKD